MAIKTADASQAKAPRPSFFSRPGATTKEHAAEVFRHHAPAVDEDGNTQCLKKARIAESTETQRDRAPEIWNDYMRNHHPVWVDLCRGHANAIQYCKSFLQLYVENSTQTRLVLGDLEESLIAAADAEILLAKRQNLENYWMVLKRPKDYPGSTDEGPVAQISHWIFHEGAEEMGLRTTPDYQKVEFTVTDIGLILKTLWICADLITFLFPLQRLVFHALVLLFSFGFRQGMIIGMKYLDVAMGVVREEDGRRRLVATFTIWRNKLWRNALEHKKGEKFQFTLTLLPYSLFCLAHLIGAIGIHRKAIKAGYQSVHDLLHKPIFEDNINYIPLEWHDDLAEQEILPMSYSTFLRILRRCLPVAGFVTAARVYAFRIGALATERIRDNLASGRFGYFAGVSNDRVFKVMRDLSKQADPDAPIEATPEEKRSIEGRRDITKRMKDLELAKATGDKKSISKAKAALDQRRRSLYVLLVADARAKYFAEANRLRTNGLTTTHLRKRTQPTRRRREHSLLDIGGLMRLWTGQACFGNREETSEGLLFDDCAEERSEQAMVWLCCRDDVTPPTISNAAAWSRHIEQAHGKIHALMVPLAVLEGIGLLVPKPQARQPKRAVTKRKREAMEPPIPGVHVFDLSEVALQQVPYDHRDEVSATPLEPESPCLLSRSDWVGDGSETKDSDTGSLGSDNGDSCDGCSLALSVDTINTPLDSPFSFSPETFPADPAPPASAYDPAFWDFERFSLDDTLLAGTVDGVCWGSEPCYGADDAGWEFLPGAEKAAQEQECAIAGDGEEWADFDNWLCD
ncbi:hypothetical protein B0T17DRAFT_658205 [Bombardia bombarda]|uniref:Uncharacterized protein n=1 Tax=Bombardia bombarda TaxID=252184 RepID=A0AA39W421_9PEZI|nr:hypothetical protein B0T17DRAFT_658205 [Bombardia bombarda]